MLSTVQSRPINHVIVPLFLLEVTATACLAVIFYYLKYLDNFEQRRYPIACWDVGWIAYPFYEDTTGLPMYMEDPALYSATFFIPAVTVIVMEIIRWFLYEGEKKVVQAGWPEWKLHFFPRRIIRIVGTLLFGMLLTCVLVFTLKFMFAIPRPNFLQACQPNMTNLLAACGGGDIYSRELSPAGVAIFFTPTSPDICLAAKHRVEDALRSFPSEHAALASFSATFVSVYLHRMASFHRLVTARPLLVSLSLLGGVAPGVGALHAYHSRWSDLLAGYGLGAAVAAYLTALTLRGFADVRIPGAGRSNLLSLTGLHSAAAGGDFKSVPSVDMDDTGAGDRGGGGCDVAPPLSIVAAGRDLVSIPRARSNTTANIYETSNRALPVPLVRGVSPPPPPHSRRYSSPVRRQRY